MPYTKQYIILSSAANIIMFVLLVATLGQIQQLKAEKTDIADSKINTNIADKKVQKKMDDVDVLITENGYSPRGFQIFADNKTAISIKNIDNKPHSFAIDELGIDKTIGPGNEIEVVIDRDFNEPTSLKFQSKLESDSPDIFSGLIMVLKQQETAGISNANNK